MVTGSSSTGLVTVTGVAPETSSIATITTTRTGYVGGSATVADPSADYTVTNSNSAITITSYIGTGGAVTIPATIGGLPVVAIGDYAFLGCTGLTSVTIPSSVTSIWGYAFYGCSGLTELNFLGAPPQLGGYLSNSSTAIVKYPKGSGATTWVSYVGTRFGGLITQEAA